MGRQTAQNAKRQRLVSVLDVGTSKVCCLIARAEAVSGPGEPARLHVVGFGHQRSQGVRSGTVVQMLPAEQAIRAAVDQAEKMAGVTIEDVILSVSCGRLKSENFSASAMVSGDAVVGHDIDRVVSAAQQYAGRDDRIVLHTLATGYRLDDNTVISDPRGMIGDRLAIDIHAVSVDEPPLRNLILCVEQCHLSVAGLAAAPYASGLAAVTDDEARLGVICIDMGAGITTVSVFADGHFIHSDAIALGGNHVTMDLARALSAPLHEAERIKTLHASAFSAVSDEREVITVPGVGEDDAGETNQVTKAQIAQIVQPRIDEILQLVSERLDAAGLAAASGRHVVLTGGGSQLTALPGYAARVLSRAVRQGKPRHLPGLPERGVGPAFAAATGLLIYSQRQDEEFARAPQTRYLATGTGYLSRVGQWIRESF